MEKIHYIDLAIVKKMMEEQSLDNKRLAQLMQVYPATVSKFLDGCDQRKINIRVIFRLAKTLNTTLKQLSFKEQR